VVVFRGLTPAAVATKYPTVRGKSDHRLLSRDQALRYLDEKIAELAREPRGADDYDFGPLQRRLEETRRIIRACL
jgi:hypothetical protein